MSATRPWRASAVLGWSLLLAVLTACGLLAACASGGHGSNGAATGTTSIVMDDPSSPELRSYLLHPPHGGVSEAAVPLVVVLHGASSSAAEFEQVSGFSDLADRERFVVAYPEATGSGPNRLWNAGFCCGPPAAGKVDDVGFVRRVVDHVAERLPVDRQRVYLVGYSNGGMLAHRIAAERPAEVVAAAVVSGTIGGHGHGQSVDQTIPAPRLPVPMLIMHGLKDQSVPYLGGEGGHGMSYIGVPKSAELWVRRNRCKLMPKLAEERSGQVLIRSFEGGAPVVVYALDGWGHDWPGHHFTDRLPADAPLRGFDAAEVIWSFLRQHHRAVESE